MSVTMAQWRRTENKRTNKRSTTTTTKTKTKNKPWRLLVNGGENMIEGLIASETDASCVAIAL